MTEGEGMRRPRSRRRTRNRAGEIAVIAVRGLLILLAVAAVAFAGTFGFRYWQGSQTSGLPLESGREIVPESMNGEKP